MDPTSRLGKRLTTVTFPEQGDIPRTGRRSPNRFEQTTTHPVQITCQAKHGRHARKIVPSAEASGPCNRLAIPPHWPLTHPSEHQRLDPGWLKPPHILANCSIHNAEPSKSRQMMVT